MTSIVDYILQAMASYGLPAAILLVIGFFGGYLFFRKRSQDEREAVATIKAANESLTAELAGAKGKLNVANTEKDKMAQCIESLQASVAHLQEECDLQSAQLVYWKDKAAGRKPSGSDPLDTALDVFVK